TDSILGIFQVSVGELRLSSYVLKDSLWHFLRLWGAYITVLSPILHPHVQQKSGPWGTWLAQVVKWLPSAQILLTAYLGYILLVST
uniref:Uncharacterized protein n=1 Tax=Mustela putorius furo TaxID=9669 RepID=M3YJK4_MUSPF